MQALATLGRKGIDEKKKTGDKSSVNVKVHPCTRPSQEGCTVLSSGLDFYHED